ncbi:MAG: hypothetical protein ABSD74_15810 [Rhizomicrobium sp.]
MTGSVGPLLIAVFFTLATCILVAVGTALLLPGAATDAIWALYPARRALLMPHHLWLGPAFLTLAVVMLLASIGCFRRRTWGWWLAVAIFAVNGASDVVQLILGHILEGAIGVAVAGAILVYLFRPDVRRLFV